MSDGRRVVMTETLAEGLAVLAGQGFAAPPRTGLEDGAPDAERVARPGAAAWPVEALALLERAESSARNGDWQGFGAALEELRSLLRRAPSAEGAEGAAAGRFPGTPRR